MRHLALCLALLAAPAAAETPAAPPDWSALAVSDVEAAYAETKANHPGMHDPANPGFPKQLERARDEALAYARRATTPGGFEASLQKFRAVLDDGHAGAFAALPTAYEPPVRWPGFVAAWRGDAMYVYKAEDGGPAAGSRIESCDGRPVAELVKTNIFGWRSGGGVPGEWWSSARRLFVDDGNPFVTLPRTCRFLDAKGGAESRKLSWSPVAASYGEWRDGSSNGDRMPIGLAERAPGIQWIAMPDFSPDEAGVAAYKALYADLAAKAEALRGARAVVLDLRFNDGGSSSWSRRVAEALWGKQAVEARANARSAKTQTWWRPTPGNLAEVRKFEELLKKQGDLQTAELVAQFVPMFEAAIAKGDTWFVEPDLSPSGAATGPAPEPLLKAPVYVVVPGQCASACLDAIDVFKLFPNTRLIGAPSSADSTYMEVRTPELPSGMAYAIIPMKMYVDRARGNGEHYEPDIAMRDFDWSTANFLARIEEDLAKR
ncbi:MAG: S41 family peptidase [Erythrobacter sp.]